MGGWARHHAFRSRIKIVRAVEHGQISVAVTEAAALTSAHSILGSQLQPFFVGIVFSRSIDLDYQV